MGESYRVIELTRGFVTIISTEDFRRVNRHSWRVHFSAGSKKKHGQPYARSTIKGKDVYLHRFIMKPEDGMHVDHLNRQTLDNRRPNLEEVTLQINMKRRRARK